MKDRPSHDERRQNYYDHQHHNLKSRDELQRRGVKASTPNLPKMDATFKGVERRMKEGDRQVNTLNQKPTASVSRDRDAQAQGFKSAAEMDAFYANRARMRKRGGSAPGTKGTPTQKEAAPKKPSGNPLTRLLDAMNGGGK